MSYQNIFSNQKQKIFFQNTFNNQSKECSSAPSSHFPRDSTPSSHNDVDGFEPGEVICEPFA
jgi:hypothetical protein